MRQKKAQRFKAVLDQPRRYFPRLRQVSPNRKFNFLRNIYQGKMLQRKEEERPMVDSSHVKKPK